MGIVAILNGLAAIPKIVGYIESFASAVTGWWIARQTTLTLSMIADAAAMSARAQTDADRFACAAAWQKALSRPKVGL